MNLNAFPMKCIKEGALSPSNKIIEEILSLTGLTKDELFLVMDRAILGGETNRSDIIEWLYEKFLRNVVLIDDKAYAKMCVDALKILGGTAATDYGSSRQRDMGQLWADMTRGYLGEQAFAQFLKKKWNIQCDLGHEIGQLDHYLPMDVHTIKKEKEEIRQPHLNISIKTTKWNGIWMDIPGDQFNHSDVHVLVKVGAGRDHLFAFFKLISVFKDKVLKIGQDVGSLTTDEASELFDKIPSFRPIPAFVCGFVLKNKSYEELSYRGRKGRKNFTITSWNGPIKAGDKDKIKVKENISGSVKFESIGDFAHDNGYLFNTGNLLWKDEEWNSVIKEM